MSTLIHNKHLSFRYTVQSTTIMKCIICQKAIGSSNFCSDDMASASGERLIFRLYEIFKKDMKGKLCLVCHALLEEYDNFRYCSQNTADQIATRSKCYEVKQKKTILPANNDVKDVRDSCVQVSLDLEEQPLATKTSSSTGKFEVPVQEVARSCQELVPSLSPRMENPSFKKRRLESSYSPTADDIDKCEDEVTRLDISDSPLFHDINPHKGALGSPNSEDFSHDDFSRIFEQTDKEIKTSSSMKWERSSVDFLEDDSNDSFRIKEELNESSKESIIPTDANSPEDKSMAHTEINQQENREESKDPLSPGNPTEGTIGTTGTNTTTEGTYGTTGSDSTIGTDNPIKGTTGTDGQPLSPTEGVIKSKEEEKSHQEIKFGATFKDYGTFLKVLQEYCKRNYTRFR